MTLTPFRYDGPIKLSFPARLLLGRRRSTASFRPQVEALEPRLTPDIKLTFMNLNPAYNYDNIYVQFRDDPNFSATLNGTPLQANTNYSLTTLNNSGNGVILQHMSHGRIFFSLGQPLNTSDGKPPEPINPSITSWSQRWDDIELTYTGTTASSVANLTSVQLFAVPLEIKTLQGGNVQQTLGFNLPGNSLISALGAITNNNPSIVLNSGGSFLRVLSPSVVQGTPAANLYPSMSPYVSYVYSWQNGTAHKTELKDHYFGNPSGSGPVYQAQDYDFTATVDAQGNLTMTGTGGVVGAHTITIAAADLLPGIYSCNPPYQLDGSPGHFDNTVYDAVIRDVLAGFNLGFVASATTDPGTGTAFGDEPSGLWFKSAKAFDFLQPSQPFYNQYAKVIAANSNAYGFPYSDRWQTVQANLNSPIDALQLVVQPDNPGGPLTAMVKPFPSAESDTTQFPVQWSAPGTVDVKSFDVYVSQDNGPFTLWQNQTTATSAFFTGQDNSTYGFYTVATDVFGNTTPTPTQAQATIQVQNPHVDYVTQLYQILLKRAPDAPGLGAWVAFLDQGGSRQLVAQEIAASPEGRGIQVDGFYQQFLHRGADAAGRAGWVNALLAGVSVTTVELGFLTSAEYLQAHPGPSAFVSGLFQDILGRPATPTELTSWAGEITAGGPLGQATVALGILTSAEAYQDFISQEYETALGRAPNPLELDGWGAVLVNRLISTDQAAALLLASDEAYLHALQQ
jgi:hypothetical protein